jgi:formamidopyrimidine-DNA glycosylase
MPELPEVETIRRALARHVVGRRVVRVDGHRVEMRRPLDPEALDVSMSGRRLAEPRRRGKFLLVDLEPPGTLLIHLGMSGRLLLQSPATPMLKHCHLVVHLENGVELRMVDPRRFGLAWWLEPGEEATDPSLSTLGLEPLDEDLPSELPHLMHDRRAPLKSLLLDQRLVAGVGNIYACEALWRAAIRPSRRGDQTAIPRLERLAREVRQVLDEAIGQGGTTIRDYVTPAGDFGSFAVRLNVYGRAGQPCPRCGLELRDDRIANRSTVWCRGCQR